MSLRKNETSEREFVPLGNGKTLTGYTCPDPYCGSQGPHSYWPDDGLADCGGCGNEFGVPDDHRGRVQ